MFGRDHQTSVGLHKIPKGNLKTKSGNGHPKEINRNLLEYHCRIIGTC